MAGTAHSYIKDNGHRQGCYGGRPGCLLRSEGLLFGSGGGGATSLPDSSGKGAR